MGWFGDACGGRALAAATTAERAPGFKHFDHLLGLVLRCSGFNGILNCVGHVEERFLYYGQVLKSLQFGKILWIFFFHFESGKIHVFALTGL